MKLALMLAVIVATGSSVATAQSNLAGRWQGEDRGRGGRSIPVVLELSVDNTTVSGTVKDGDAPAGPIANGRFANGTLTFTTSVFLNGTEIVLTWEGTLDGDRLPLVRRLPNGTALPPLDMRRNKKQGPVNAITVSPTRPGACRGCEADRADGA